MATPPIVTQYAGPTPYKLTNVETNINVFNSYIPFYPNQLSDLAIWLDGTDILNNSSNNPADGTAMDYWANKAPNAISVTQDTSSYRPTFNSLTGVDFVNTNNEGGINGFDTTYSPGDYKETVFILLNNTTTENDYNLLYPELSYGRQLYLNSNTDSQTTLTTAIRSGPNLLQAGIVTSDNPTLVSMTSSNIDNCNITVSININHYINGLLTGTYTDVDKYNFGINTLIGTDNYVGNNGFNGSISEIIIYSNTLSDSDRQKVESYLYWKWNKNFSLDPSNPYTEQAYSNQASLYPNINSNLIPPIPRNLFSGLPTLDSNNYPLIKNFIQLPNRLRNVMF
jgi:hypothetical protein